MKKEQLQKGVEINNRIENLETFISKVKRISGLVKDDNELEGIDLTIIHMAVHDRNALINCAETKINELSKQFEEL